MQKRETCPMFFTSVPVANGATNMIVEVGIRWLLVGSIYFNQRKYSGSVCLIVGVLEGSGLGQDGSWTVYWTRRN